MYVRYVHKSYNCLNTYKLTLFLHFLEFISFVLIQLKRNVTINCYAVFIEIITTINNKLQRLP